LYFNFWRARKVKSELTDISKYREGRLSMRGADYPNAEQKLPNPRVVFYSDP
jgi:predicted NAD-dependent protein-ADP-ribosyltransferase YbiA (DUF1768 family)